MKLTLLSIIILIGFCSCTINLESEKTNQHVLIPDIGTYLIPISQAIPAASYDGFQDEDKRWSIAVKYVDDSMDVLRKTYQKANLYKRGYTLLRSNKVKYLNKYPGVWVEYEDKRRQLTRYYMFIDLGNVRATVKGNLPTSRVEVWGYDVRESMRSFYLDDSMFEAFEVLGSD